MSTTSLHTDGMSIIGRYLSDSDSKCTYIKMKTDGDEVNIFFKDRDDFYRFCESHNIDVEEN